MPLKVKLSSIMVDDQEKALQFYTEVLGFVKKTEIPMGEFKWLTVVSTDNDYVELLLEPIGFEAAKTFQKALYDAGITATAFEVDDIEAEHKRLVELGVTFRHPPKDAGGVMIAAFDDTCGNLIQLYQV